MEFTPKKPPATFNSSTVRRNPYSTGSRNYLKKYQHRGGKAGTPHSSYGTPPRTALQKRFSSRSEKMVTSALKALPQPEEGNSLGKWLGKKDSSPQALKRPFSAINGTENTKDPYNIFSDNEEDVFIPTRKESKPSPNSDKENSLFGPPKAGSVKVYGNKKKPMNLCRSRLVSDISPEKIEKAYGPKSYFSAEKENVPTELCSEQPVSSVTPPHLIGFPNYGNTCYLNSVIQSLFGLSSFLLDYRIVASHLDMAHTSLFYGLSQVLSNRMKGQVSGVKQSLKTVKENLERVDGSFSGFKMQDANEFLTRVLDTIKDEIDRCHMTTPSPDRPSGSQSLTCTPNGELDEEVYLSGCTRRDPSPIKQDTVKNNDSPTVKSPELENKTHCNGEGISEEVCMENSQDLDTDDVLAERIASRENTQLDTPTKHTAQEVIPRNPVKDNFEFQLLESYRCLGCDEVEGRKQEYFGLYVNLPEEGRDTIQDAISSYMSADERELKCEKCLHNRSSVVTTVTRLPRILIVQLKRYEYKPEQCESIKMSSRVHINRWITLDPYLTGDVEGPSPWSPNSVSTIVPRPPKQATLTVRNLSSELNVCESKKDKEELCLTSPVKAAANVPIAIPDNEDEELQEVMRRSMNDIGGGEDDEIQQAIRLSLQELGMTYSQENQVENAEEENEENIARSASQDDSDIESGLHTYRLMSIISHFGLTTNTGHYVSDIYNCEEGSWFHYDDETVTKISESVVLADGRQKNGYIFFYVHKDLFEKMEKKTQNER
ncbi:LOW QUALITY PROTEIN: ubiquitin carboxyl-terminal hydrolase 37-like [Penaeus monodon]|uniref:LOW QUALITY PROTEIN: ubiquitin carboxyl-terminal hydrolase 37-like n=1 Tax=Penaeus monodon TaxID=6687 RepID=UPI0018A70A0A|nr:LOW QUALITY PROTEIN: ubiquitin carboxyl-terminal hydrolase 37-like [Penaeus monodon]